MSASLIAGAALALLGASSEVQTYTYDALGRLTNVAHSGTVNSGAQVGYAYDAADNRTSVTATAGAQSAGAALSAAQPAAAVLPSASAAPTVARTRPILAPSAAAPRAAKPSAPDRPPW